MNVAKFKQKSQKSQHHTKFQKIQIQISVKNTQVLSSKLLTTHPSATLTNMCPANDVPVQSKLVLGFLRGALPGHISL
jgi:hypothetical protein